MSSESSPIQTTMLDRFKPSDAMDTGRFFTKREVTRLVDRFSAARVALEMIASEKSDGYDIRGYAMSALWGINAILDGRLDETA